MIKKVDESKYNELADAIKTLLHMFDVAQYQEQFVEQPVKQRYIAAANDVLDQQFDKELEKFIDVIRDDRYYDDDVSRKVCIAIFKYLREEHPTTLKCRREFSSALS